MRRKGAIDKNLKEFRRLILAKDKDVASKLIPSIYQALDKAAKTGYIKSNTSSRLKSRIMRARKKLDNV